MQGRQDVSRFVKAFTGDNRYILDYLTEEVLYRQPKDVQCTCWPVTGMKQMGRQKKRFVMPYLERTTNVRRAL
jgi:ATP/maltotriose-dependent transcriptional regulator MalT